MRLRGIHTVRKHLADGTVKVFRYYRPNGAVITGEPGTPAFLASYMAAKDAKIPNDGDVRSLVAQFKASAEWKKLAAKTQRDYRRYLDAIGDRFGDLDLEALNDHRVRADFFEWRDEMAATPRTADYAWQTLRRLLGWAYDRGKIAANHAVEPGRLYDSQRADLIWKDEQIVAFLDCATVDVELKHMLAAAHYSGQREGDLIRLAWTNYDGAVIRLRQGKRRQLVEIKVHREWKAVLDTMPKRGPLIHTTPFGRAWQLDHFRHSWREGMVAAGLGDSGLHFHDLRGTAFTNLLSAGSSLAEAARVMGWSLKHASAVADDYAAMHDGLAAAAIRKLENAAGTEGVNQAVNRTLAKQAK